MDRRNFIKGTSTVIAGATLAPSAFASDLAAGAASGFGGRMILPMNRSWRFSKKSTDASHARDFDDSGYDPVVVPHTNARLPWHSFDEKTYEFVSSYRRRFKLPAEAKGKHV